MVGPRKPAEGDYVTWTQEYLNGTHEELTGRVQSLLSVMFTLYVQGRTVPYYVKYNAEWRISNEN